ncbi:hypothetical protein GCM10023093_03760 [Nemorincola caseinilytica]|uniref:EF-hand domain-containing protein n=1 Tax=Nemorincola caseinilytica TaxID=2054315 RepID=A0ABP8N6H9_9BACT
MITGTHNGHTWHFSTIGGVKRVNIDTANDLVHLKDLDPKLWTALSCPINGLEIDPKTLALIDTDNDGQIKVPEVIDAVNWMVSVLKDPGDLLLQNEHFPISAINDATEEGRTLLESAKVILRTLGKTHEQTLTVEETGDTKKIFATTLFNGDGIISEDATTDATLVQLMKEIMQHAGSVTDRGGKEGISTDILNAFFEQCQQYVAWQAKRENAPDTITPLGAHTDAAYNNYLAIKAKVDDLFIRCRLAAFDPASAAVLNLQTERVAQITTRDLSAAMDEIATYPLARIEAGRSLPLTTGINPAWEAQMHTFRQLTASKLFPGKDSITEQEWNGLAAVFAPYAVWLAEKGGNKAEPLGLDRVREILAGDGKERLAALIAEDNATAQEANNIIMVNKLVRYYRDLYKLIRNFVTFFDFYTPGSKAIFQAGTLYIDQRSCDLCIKVSDIARHNALAAFSGMYLLYCDCTSKATNEKMTIVAALTNGDVDNLVVGRNALFFDRQGNDWDATIMKIVENPISIRQAFFSPYRKAVNFIETNVNKMAASQDEKVVANMNTNIESLPAKAEESKEKKAPAPPFDVGKFVGIFAAIGLALGAIGTALASVVGGFMKLTWWKMPLAIAGLLLVISGPAMVIAYLKLRKRNLAPILDANGWAINANVVINIYFGKTLTQLAELPDGSRVNINDPFTKKKQPIWPAVFLFSVMAGVALYLLIKHKILNIHF